ncbi:MAG TPA: DUF4157 domain-containing protein [Candidatus Solibacter sp.]|nr:DUF4157 domain-containing protein [Candidatus Solibacter sp.]
MKPTEQQPSAGLAPPAAGPAPANAPAFLHLQRTVGNQAVLNLFRTGAVQAKLRISQPGDPFEQEADRVTDQVMRMPLDETLLPALPQIHRKCAACASGAAPCSNCAGAEEDLHIHRKEHGGGAGAEPSVADNFLSHLGPGQPLDAATRSFFEPRFRRDFSSVRIHTDSRAAESARAVGARAFTAGPDIAFESGEYSPGTSLGLRLLSHELTHVVQQGQPGNRLSGTLLRAPAPKPKQAQGGLPWKQGQYSLFEEYAEGIHFLVGVAGEKTEKSVRAEIPAIAKRIAADNAIIKDPAYQVKTCFIVRTTTRFALYQGKSVLMLDPSDAHADTAAHEMGHALFYSLKMHSAGSSPDAQSAGNFRRQIGDIYARLAVTKLFTEGKETHAAGLFMVDPSQVTPGQKIEHPWSDPDEFFASAKEAYQTNPSGLRRSIARFVKYDPSVKGPAQELLALLQALLDKRELPKSDVPASRKKASEESLQRETRVSNVEDTLGPRVNEVLLWILQPESRPAAEEVGTEVTSPLEERKKVEHPNLVTGKGGVKEKLEKGFEDRIRQKLLESVEDLP